MTGGLPIRTRLTLVYSGLLFLALAISGVAVVTMMRQRLTARMDAALDLRLQGVENFLIRETTAATAHMIPAELSEYASTQPEGHYIEVLDQQGGPILRSEPVQAPSRSRYRTFSIYGKTYRTRASASEEPIVESVQEIGFLLLGSAPVLLLLLGCTGYWISSRALRPVDEMTRSARSIGTNNLSGRLPVPPPRDEIRRLAEAWNEMLGRLEESFTRMQRFTADAAHELRTPLATLRTTADLTLKRDREPQEYRDALTQIGGIAERMNQLAENLLAAARGDQAIPKPLERLDLLPLVEGIVSEMRPLFDDKDVRLETSFPRQLPAIAGDRDGLLRILAVLLDNALKYSPPGSTVTVAISGESGEIGISVADTGCGIPKESLSRIFDRFYRVDSSRDRKTGGYGLGLSIAQQIANAHQGRIEADSEPGQGSTFVLKLPTRT